MASLFNMDYVIIGVTNKNIITSIKAKKSVPYFTKYQLFCKVYISQNYPKICFPKSYAQKSLQCIEHSYTNNEYLNENNYVYVPKCNVLETSIINICNDTCC